MGSLSGAQPGASYSCAPSAYSAALLQHSHLGTAALATVKGVDGVYLANQVGDQTEHLT